jgi:hypothetical protein
MPRRRYGSKKCQGVRKKVDGDSHCRNRNIVNVENRLVSPFYDAEGDDGGAWHEFGSIGGAACYYGWCTGDSYQAWVDAANKYFNDKLVPQYNRVYRIAMGDDGSAANLPQIARDRLMVVRDFIDDWKASPPNRDEYTETAPNWVWKSRVEEIAKCFDEAACKYDDLDKILTMDLGHAGGQAGYSEDPLIGHASAKGGSSSGIGKAMGVVALGAAAYFGFKVLTE